jgi:hypothetical protein
LDASMREKTELFSVHNALALHHVQEVIVHVIALAAK